MARLVAELLQSLGYLKRGHLVETDRAGLVAAFVGQTAIKVQEVVTSAMGGMLFVDEVETLYALDAHRARTEELYYFSFHYVFSCILIDDVGINLIMLYHSIMIYVYV